ncbi:MAG TPA: hypothetical protein VHV32_18930 [Candidatus Angelobacter sp.]|jgi:hypothetical protein|nr:hypothetical protein [Candidatus Angelobacter sp.]
MLDKLPDTPSWVWIMSLVGAGVGYLEDFKWEDDWKTWLLKGLVKSSSSGLAAFLMYHALAAFKVESDLQFVVVGIAAHMGCEFLKVAGEAIRRKVD